MTSKNIESAINLIEDEVASLSQSEALNVIEYIRDKLHKISPLQEQPVDRISWVDVNQVSPNDYNPNSVAKNEMSLLYTSIKHDGYTQPVVTIWDDELQKYVIIDGFHRYFTCKNNEDIHDRNLGHLPIVVLDKEINDRMASTVRHNRARGKHSVGGMSHMVFSMLDNGWSDSEICNHLGMQPDEILRLKHITGFSKLFEDAEYSRTWTTKSQIRLKKQYSNVEKSEK